MGSALLPHRAGQGVGKDQEGKDRVHKQSARLICKGESVQGGHAKCWDRGGQVGGGGGGGRDTSVLL